MGSGSTRAKETANCLRSQTLLNRARNVQYFCPSWYDQADVWLFIKRGDRAELWGPWLADAACPGHRASGETWLLLPDPRWVFQLVQWGKRVGREKHLCLLDESMADPCLYRTCGLSLSCAMSLWRRRTEQFLDSPGGCWAPENVLWFKREFCMKMLLSTCLSELFCLLKWQYSGKGLAGS